MCQIKKSLVVICLLNLILFAVCDNNNLNNNNQQQQQQQQHQQQQHQQQQKSSSSQDVWEQDLTDTFKIEGSDQGIQKVNLKCGSNSMHVMLETEKDFTGVMYTRGSFYKQSEPCFVKPARSSSRNLEMTFSLDQCQTQQDGDLYSNIVVIQNDPELITPGDSAFSLECDFRQPRNVQVEADMQTRDRLVTGSRITLTSPDPSNVSNNLDDIDTVHSESDTVTYLPNKSRNSDAKKVLGTVEEIPMNIEWKSKKEELNRTETNSTSTDPKTNEIKTD